MVGHALARSFCSPIMIVSPYVADHGEAAIYMRSRRIVEIGEHAMAKTTAPFLSFGGRGQIGKSMVASSWKGINYMRSYVVPANPRTSAQQETRGVFKWLNGIWKLGDSDLQAPWTGYAKGQKLTNRNAFIKFNLPSLRGSATGAGFVGSPGSNGGLAAVAAVSSDGGTHILDITMTAPALPSGWSIVEAVACAFLEANVETSLVYKTTTAVDTSTPFEPTMALTAGTYVWSAWFVFLKPDSTTAYGPSISGTQVLA